jgi:NADPH:quinone reductase-like Zn-dependent oxidoreductase
MRAVLFRKHGGPEVMEVAEIATPTPGPGEVQIRVAAVALNHIDLWMRRGLPSMKIALPHVPGGDVCGTVSALGAAVRGVEVGARVVVNPGLSCGRCRHCLGGRDNLCPDFRMLGEHVQGAMAEFVVVPAANLVPIPPPPPSGKGARLAITDAEWAAIPISFITAWQMLVDKARIKRGETVLVLGAGSGVGVAAIQIAKLFGTRVIAAASTDRKLAAARAIGADDVFNYVEEDLVVAVKRLTDRRGADVVVEHTGATTFPKSVVAAAHGGRIVTCGATDGHEAILNLRHVFWRQLSILGSTLAPKSSLFEVLDRVAAGQLRPVVDRVLPLAEIAEAHRALESREAFGKIVLTLD